VLFCHATPSDPLFAYRPQDSDLWLTDEVDRAIQVELVGHTHVPFRRALPERVIVNPGSVGQPKHGRAEACYALWQDGKITLASAPYDFKRTIDKLRDCRSWPAPNHRFGPSPPGIRRCHPAGDPRHLRLSPP
jgi:diadenosine tetraphosphatase ApaH/serine/threonine PP2A family protein phosphatase